MTTFDDKVFHAGLRWDSYGLWYFQMIKNVYGYSNLNSHDRHAHKMHACKKVIEVLMNTISRENKALLNNILL